MVTGRLGKAATLLLADGIGTHQHSSSPDVGTWTPWVVKPSSRTPSFQQSVLGPYTPLTGSKATGSPRTELKAMQNELPGNTHLKKGYSFRKSIPPEDITRRGLQESAKTQEPRSRAEGLPRSQSTPRWESPSKTLSPFSDFAVIFQLA